MRRLERGAVLDGEPLGARSVHCLRTGTKYMWLDVVFTEGRNRHIRRWLDHFGVNVLRLVRVRVGELSLAELSKEQWRMLAVEEETPTEEGTRFVIRGSGVRDPPAPNTFFYFNTFAQEHGFTIPIPPGRRLVLFLWWLSGSASRRGADPQSAILEIRARLESFPTVRLWIASRKV
jgi:hypothetical protein